MTERPPWADPVFTDAVEALQPIATHLHDALQKLTRLRWSEPTANPSHTMNGFGAAATMSAKDGAGWWELEAILIHADTGVEISVKPPAAQYPGWRRCRVGYLHDDYQTKTYAYELVRYAPPPLSMVLRSSITRHR
jgi:hypothetical protein